MMTMSRFPRVHAPRRLMMFLCCPRWIRILSSEAKSLYSASVAPSERKRNVQNMNSPYRLSYTSRKVSSENLVVHEDYIHLLISFVILITCLLEDVLILQGEMIS